MKVHAILVIALIYGTVLCGCIMAPASQETTLTNQITTPAPTGPSALVIIRARAFDPAKITIQEGTTVTWKNEDSITHHVVHSPEVSHEKLFDSGQLSPGQSFSYTFTQKGQYKYSDSQIGGSPPYIINVE